VIIPPRATPGERDSTRIPLAQMPCTQAVLPAPGLQLLVRAQTSVMRINVLMTCLSAHVSALFLSSGLAPVRRRGVIHPGGDSPPVSLLMLFLLRPGWAAGAVLLCTPSLHSLRFAPPSCALRLSLLTARRCRRRAASSSSSCRRANMPRTCVATLRAELTACSNALPHGRLTHRSVAVRL
jgi:hypothetical protein